jgi:hypothetical protein
MAPWAAWRASSRASLNPGAYSWTSSGPKIVIPLIGILYNEAAKLGCLAAFYRCPMALAASCLARRWIAWTREIITFAAPAHAVGRAYQSHARIQRRPQRRRSWRRSGDQLSSRPCWSALPSIAAVPTRSRDTAATGQEATYATQQRSPSRDHLVGAGQQHWWPSRPSTLRLLQIDRFRCRERNGLVLLGQSPRRGGG